MSDYDGVLVRPLLDQSVKFEYAANPVTGTIGTTPDSLSNLLGSNVLKDRAGVFVSCCHATNQLFVCLKSGTPSTSNFTYRIASNTTLFIPIGKGIDVQLAGSGPSTAYRLQEVG